MWLVILLIHLNDCIIQLIKVHNGLKLVAPSCCPRMLLFKHQLLLMKGVVAASLCRGSAEPICRAKAWRARDYPQLLRLLAA